MHHHHHFILLCHIRRPSRHYTTSSFSSFVVSSISWVRDRALDHAVEKERDLKPMISLKNLIISQPSKTLPLFIIQDKQSPLNIPIRPIDFIRKYPSVFNGFFPSGISTIHPHVKLTEEIVSLQKLDVVNRLLKLLMIARVNRIPLWVIDRNDLELVCWSSDLAVSVMELKGLKAALRFAISECVEWLPPQRVKDLENFILNFFNDLPEMIIVCMNFLEDGVEKLLYEFLPHSDTKTWIMFSRLNSGSVPISAILPIQKILEKTTAECSCDMELEFLAEAILTNGCYTNGLHKIDTDKLTLIYKRIREGTTKTKPYVKELRAALSAHDLYIYLSHGCGEQYIAVKFIQKMNKCPVALLMGCDSRRVTLCGSLVPKGTPIHYLLGGSPAILCNLWTMGDIEIGWFTKDLVLELINKAKTTYAQRLHNTNEEGPSKKRKSDAPINPGSFLIKGRKSCDLKYLTGALTAKSEAPEASCPPVVYLTVSALRQSGDADTKVEEEKVWAIADSKRQGYLGFKEFIIAMQLLSLAQAGHELNSNLLKSSASRS
nr:hypothetical protein [Tanacetum cinerariifolium]